MSYTISSATKAKLEELIRRNYNSPSESFSLPGADFTFHARQVEFVVLDNATSGLGHVSIYNGSGWDDMTGDVTLVDVDGNTLTVSERYPAIRYGEVSGKPVFITRESAASVTTPLSLDQASNGDDVITSKRATDSGPTGNFIKFESHGGTVLFQVNALGILLLPYIQEGIYYDTFVADVDNYAVPNVGTLVVNVNNVAGVTLSGIANGTSGRVLRLIVSENSTGVLQLTDEDIDSTAANRFILPAPIVVLIPGDGATLVWDDASPVSRWRYADDIPLTQMSITSDANGLMLVNDQTSPGNFLAYATGAGGTKGWIDKGIVVQDNSGSVAFTNCIKITFDATQGFIVSAGFGSHNGAVSIANAGVSQVGVVNTGTQTYGGVKTFHDDVITNQTYSIVSSSGQDMATISGQLLGGGGANNALILQSKNDSGTVTGTAKLDNTGLTLSNGLVYKIVVSSSTFTGATGTDALGNVFKGGIITTVGGGSVGTGTVTTFSTGNLSPLFTATVSNPTSTPALSFAQVSQTQNLFFASPNGSSGNPTFRAIAAADLPSGTASSALSHYTGTTTSSFATVFNYAPSAGVHGCFSIKNSGVTNGLNAKITATDQYGNTANFTQAVATNAIVSYNLDSPFGAILTVYPPFASVKLEVDDFSGGSHTTYDIYTSFIG